MPFNYPIKFQKYLIFSWGWGLWILECSPIQICSISYNLNYHYHTRVRHAAGPGHGSCVSVPGGHPEESVQGARVCPHDALAAEVSEVWSGFQGCRHHLHAYVGVLPECMRGGDHTGHDVPRPSPGHGAYFLKGYWKWGGMPVIVITLISSLCKHDPF